MSTATRIKIGPLDHGRRMSFDEFVEADFEETGLYELARGVVVVTEVPDLPHGLIMMRLVDLFAIHMAAFPGRIQYRAGGGECRIRLPGMQSDRHPDQAVYLSKPPNGPGLWSRWMPSIVVEVVSERGEDRDYVEKRDEYLAAGIDEYWVVDPSKRVLLVLKRNQHVWIEYRHSDTSTYAPDLLPGLVVDVAELLGPAELSTAPM